MSVSSGSYKPVSHVLFDMDGLLLGLYITVCFTRFLSLSHTRLLVSRSYVDTESHSVATQANRAQFRSRHDELHGKKQRFMISLHTATMSNHVGYQLI